MWNKDGFVANTLDRNRPQEKVQNSDPPASPFMPQNQTSQVQKTELISHPSSPTPGTAPNQTDGAGLDLVFHIKTIELEFLCPHRSEMTGFGEP